MKVAVLFVVIAGLYLLSSVSPASVEAPETVPVHPSTTNSNQDASNKQQKKGDCECAVFNNTETPAPDEEPLLSKSPIDVVCDDSGKELCQSLCTALAHAARDHANDTICLSFVHVVNLKPSIFTRVCNQAPYVYSGVTSPEAFCCHENKAVQCKQFEV